MKAPQAVAVQPIMILERRSADGLLIERPSGDTVKLGRLVADPRYRGRFVTLACDYDAGGWRQATSTILAIPHDDQMIAAGIVTLYDYLHGKLYDAFTDLLPKIADGEIEVRGIECDRENESPPARMPPARATHEMWLDTNGDVWEGKAGQSRRWRSISINWLQLQENFFPKAAPPEPPKPAFPSDLSATLTPNTAKDAARRAHAKLIDDLLYGRITCPEEAERMAAEQGLEPLNKSPDKSLYDPNRLTRWTISMAVAWIAWRDLARVQIADNEYRKNSCEWIFRNWRGPTNLSSECEPYAGWWLETSANMIIFRLVCMALEAKPLHHSIEEAQKLLWDAAADGKITGEALRGGDVVDIPRREWRFLEVDEDQGSEVLVLSSMRAIPYREVAFQRTRLLELWPPNGVAPSDASKIRRDQKSRDVIWAIKTKFPEHPNPLSLNKKERGEVLDLLKKAKGRRCPTSDGALIRLLGRLRDTPRRDNDITT